MPTDRVLRERHSLTKLQEAYEKGDKKPLEDLMRAWKGIKELPPTDPRSFFVIGGYHGEPFRGAGWGVGLNVFWGGYCHHGNVLFPVWHRIYLLVLEDALRSIRGCKDVTMPFWDECSDESLKHGIPWALTEETFELDGQTIPNPLRSFTFPRAITDNVAGDIPNYSKPEGYETVRYPYSGLVGTPADAEKTKQHNRKWPYRDAVRELNGNIVGWLGKSVVIKDKTVPTGVHQQFLDCLKAPNYTVFSNTSSAAQWADDTGSKVVPLESPHNHIHLAVGGYDVPTGPNAGDRSPIPGANGDMGENDTAGLDPIFYFHHAFIDRVFWLWQKKTGNTETLDVIEHYPGTNSVDGQGATPGVTPNSWLSMETPLEPFKRADGAYYTGSDAVDIEKLGYRYCAGSLEDHARATGEEEAADDGRKVHVLGINRNAIRGSFLITAYANEDGERVPIGTEAVLSRWHVEGCANCQTHVQARASFHLHDADEEGVHVEVDTRDGLLGGGARSLGAAAEARAPFRVEIR
ncbi:MAG: tyrosinase family protein [Actinomycetota bacterium]|nr:tyrosinase family protein [Actinomycetota bacterium]MDQ5807884.1 tyrosinase family protein [Actinomycetota bacterium]